MQIIYVWDKDHTISTSLNFSTYTPCPSKLTVTDVSYVLLDLLTMINNQFGAKEHSNTIMQDIILIKVHLCFSKRRNLHESSCLNAQQQNEVL